jgi:hypothetical protein
VNDDTPSPNESTPDSFRTPDQSRVTLDAPGYELCEPWSASVRIRTRRPYAGTPEGLQLRELHITKAGNYDRVLEHVIDGCWANVVEAQDGHFMIGHSDSAEQGLAVWRGSWHEAATWLPDPKLAGSHALRYFARLRFVDSPEGLTVKPTLPAADVVDVLDVSKRVPGVGFLDIRKPATSHQLVPAWRGTRLPSGEVWREELPTSPDQPPDVVLIHATPTTVTTLSGEREATHLEEPRLEFLDRIAELCWDDA